MKEIRGLAGKASLSALCGGKAAPVHWVVHRKLDLPSSLNDDG